MTHRPTQTPCVLVTGVSGVGKSAVLRELRRRVQRLLAVDMDDPGWWYRDQHGHQRWVLSRLISLLDERAGEPVFVSGCSEDQAALARRWTHRVLLSAPEAVMRERVLAREDNPYGKCDAQWMEIMTNQHEVEPILRRSATLEIVTTIPIQEVATRVLQHVGLPS